MFGSNQQLLSLPVSSTGGSSGDGAGSSGSSGGDRGAGSRYASIIALCVALVFSFSICTFFRSIVY